MRSSRTEFGFQRAEYNNLVTPHFAEKADEMTSTNKDSEILLDRDLDRSFPDAQRPLFIVLNLESEFTSYSD
ncbi:hypothetical protein ACFX1W_030214 [Malus domestica]